MKKKVLSSPILQGNTFSVNLFLFLGIAGFIIVGVDLSSELALSKDEISVIMEAEGSSPVILNAATSVSIVFDMDSFGIAYSPNFLILNHEFTSSPNDRAPPKTA